MKKIILVLFSLIFLTGYSCDPAYIDFLQEANIPEDSKNLKLYEDSSEDYSNNLIFRLGNDLYVYGKKFLKVDDKSYEYLGNGYYKNGETIYFFTRKVAKIKGEHKIKTSVKIKTNGSMKGTSCEGAFHDYTYYLEIDGMKFKNDRKEENFLNLLINHIKSFRDHLFGSFLSEFKYKTSQ